jgi:hypothetical protein
MPAIYYIIKKFLERYQPIQKKLEAVEYSLEIEKLMQKLCTMPAEKLKAKLAASSITIESLNLSAAEFLNGVDALFEAEKTRQRLQQATFEELHKLNKAITDKIRKQE